MLEASLTGVVPNGEQSEILRAMVEEGDPTNKLAESGGDSREEESDDGT